jgi:hypothetical protein
MHRSRVSRHCRLAGSLLALAALVAACGGTSTPSEPATSSVPSSVPSSVSPAGSSPAASATAGTSGDPAGQLLGIKISPPYNLTDLSASKADAIQAGIEKDLGAYGQAVPVAVKSIDQGGTVAAYLMVVAFPRGTLSDDVYKQVLTDLAIGAEADFTPKLISAVPVSFGTMSGGSVAVFRTGDLVFITLSPTTADLTPVVTSLVQVNG